MVVSIERPIHQAGGRIAGKKKLIEHCATSGNQAGSQAVRRLEALVGQIRGVDEFSIYFQPGDENVNLFF